MSYKIIYTFPEWVHQLILKKQHLANHTACSRIILIKINIDGHHKSLGDTPRCITISLAFPLHFYNKGLWMAFFFSDIFNQSPQIIIMQTFKKNSIRSFHALLLCHHSKQNKTKFMFCDGKVTQNKLTSDFWKSYFWHLTFIQQIFIAVLLLSCIIPSTIT